MKIRAITQFIPLTWPFNQGEITSAARFLANARHRLTNVGFEVQSVCLATPPFLDVISYPDPDLLFEFAHTLEELADTHNIDCVSIGPVVATTPLSLLMSIHTLPQLIAETKKIYAAVLFADQYSGVNLAAAYDFAQSVCKISSSTPNGMGNVRLAALANVPPNVPFPHVAYHHGGRAAFSIATEAADLALTAINNSRSLSQAGERLVESIETISGYILEVVDKLVDDHQIHFKGIDFSLVPYPTHARSIGAAVESLGIRAFGGSGTLFAMAFLSNAIQQTNVPRAGFSGVMLPVLEDSVLAQRAAEGSFSVHDLLLYSAISSAGLDLIPIPGNTEPDEIAAILLDMAALAISSSKPMSARLLPIPNRAVGEKVSFDIEGLAGSRILPVKNLGIRNLFEQNSFLTLHPVPGKQRTNSEIYPTLDQP